MASRTGKTVIVTGASKGIGAAIASAMVAAGARVIAHFGSDRAGVDAAVAAGKVRQVSVLQADFAHADEVDRFWEQAFSFADGRIDVLVNNAGVMCQSGGISDPMQEWDRVWAEAMAINVHAPARLMRHAVRSWLAAGEAGSIIGIGSWVSTRGTANPGAMAQSAPKVTIAAGTKAVGRNYAAEGILADVIGPGVVRTRMAEERAAKTGGEAAVTAALPMGEWVPPAEIAELAVFLAEGRARHMTGATIDINGAAYIR